MSLVESELGGSTVFKDLGKLDFDWVPEELPHREEEIRQLTRSFKGLATSGQRSHALILGPVGSGKTAMAKRFSTDLQRFLRNKGKRLEVVHINCRKRKTSGLAMLGILNKFDPNYPERGFGVGEMQRDLRKLLQRQEAHLLVVLDEIDALIRADGSDLIYDLTRFNDESGPSWHGLSLIGVSQHPDILEQLEDAARSTFTSKVIQLEGYSPTALESIVDQRVELAFHPGTWDPDTRLLVADVAAENGDARRAIELMRLAGTQADDEGMDHIRPDHVRSAKAHVQSHVTQSKLQNLATHPKLVLLALARKLQGEDSAYCTTGQVEDTYKLVCEEYEETPRGHTMFWKYLKQLQDAGMILTRISGKGQAGTTQHISIPDAPAPIVIQKLESMLKS